MSRPVPVALLQNNKWKRAKEKFLLELFSLLLLEAILCSENGGRKFDLRSWIFFLLACCSSVLSLRCAVPGFNIN